MTRKFTNEDVSALTRNIANHLYDAGLLSQNVLSDIAYIEDDVLRTIQNVVHAYTYQNDLLDKT